MNGEQEPTPFEQELLKRKQYLTGLIATSQKGYASGDKVIENFTDSRVLSYLEGFDLITKEEHKQYIDRPKELAKLLKESRDSERSLQRELTGDDEESEDPRDKKAPVTSATTE